MNLALYNESFLISQFREFYTEVIRLKRLVKSKGWVSPGENEPGNGHGVPGEGGTWIYYPEISGIAVSDVPEREKIRSLAVRSAAPSTTKWPAVATISDFASQPPSSDHTRASLLVWQSLISLFRRNAVQVLRTGGAPAESYFEAQYVMAAFADEVFINMDWEGKRTWTSNLLESTLFQSHVAGDLFFEKLETLLQNRDPADRSLAAIYLNALALGFRGKYRDVNDHGQLRRYRQELFAFVFQYPSDLENESKIAFPAAYVQTVRQEKKKLTNPRLWLGVLGLVILSYLALSTGLWWSLTSRLEEPLLKVEKLIPKR